ncbi:MAG: carboxylesterase family protein [Candidatus Dadabacteria bacterium]|nr:MAG: carboxylesterase family protein [Candidatus Dadabacteria bacterium]
MHIHRVTNEARQEAVGLPQAQIDFGERLRANRLQIRLRQDTGGERMVAEPFDSCIEMLADNLHQQFSTGSRRHVVHEYIRVEHDRGDFGGNPLGHLLLPAVQQPLYNERTDALRFLGIKDQIDREPVGDVADDESGGRQQPPARPDDPDDHLRDTKQEAEVEPGIADEVQLGSPNALEDLGQQVAALIERVLDDEPQVENFVDIGGDIVQGLGHDRFDFVSDQRSQLRPGGIIQRLDQRRRDALDLFPQAFVQPFVEQITVLEKLARIEPVEDFAQIQQMRGDKLRSILRGLRCESRDDPLPAEPRMQPDELLRTEHHQDRNGVGAVADRTRDQRNQQNGGICSEAVEPVHSVVPSQTVFEAKCVDFQCTCSPLGRMSAIQTVDFPEFRTMFAKRFLAIIPACLSVTFLGCDSGSWSPPDVPTTVAKAEIDCATPVKTTEGEVVGTAASSDACAWQGIPFAAPPTGERRFRPPEPPASYGTLDATTYRPDCPQILTGFLAPAGTDEDCLFLNIWRPSVDTGHGLDNLPVMVFIYGGAFQLGGGSWFLYEGTDLTRHGVVVVTFNYRLGPAGYLAHPDLVTDNSKGANGSWGTLDQIAALDWVQQNIRNFGGDPDNVTVFGESAGAISTCQMIASPLAEGRFQHALMESGNCVAGTPKQSFAQTVQYLTEAGCPTTGAAAIDCLRDKTPQELWDAVTLDTSFAFWPHVDGVALKQQPIDAIESGSASDVDLIAGFNDDEMTVVRLLPVFSKSRNMDWDSFYALIADEYGSEVANAVRENYAAEEYDSPVELWFDVLEDHIFTCSSMSAVQALGSTRRTYMYDFAVEPGAFDTEPWVRTFHSLELSFVFGNSAFLQLFYHNDDSAERIIRQSEIVQRYWTRFARTGDPNGDDDPRWPEYKEDRTIMHLDEAPDPLPGFKAGACDFWNKVLPRNNDDLFHYMARLNFYDSENIAIELPF